MSVTSTESHKLSDPNYVLKKYYYYKSTCKELIKQNDGLYQELHTTKNKLELKILELNDATSLIDEKSNELDNMIIEMDQLKKDLLKKKQDLLSLNNNNIIFSNEIITLKTQLNDLSLQNNAKRLALEKIKKNKEVGQSSDQKTPIGIENTKTDVKCDSWWCPKHSNLAVIYKKLDIQSLNDKIEIDQAIKRQRYWSRQGEIRCCVFGRKSGVDKHTNPPRCWIEYNLLLNQKLDLIEKKVNSLNLENDATTFIISSDEES